MDWSNSLVSGLVSFGLIMYGLFACPMGWCADSFGGSRTQLTSISFKLFGLEAAGKLVGEVFAIIGVLR